VPHSTAILSPVRVLSSTVAINSIYILVTTQIISLDFTLLTL
jgi:hypothetical protein